MSKTGDTKRGANSGSEAGILETDGEKGKAVVLFSDGTGNSSAKLFKTNVWRLYEASDLGPSSPGKRKQISFYDDGVGTSAFKPLAALGGIFGWGLHRNVLDIYRYACRNYEEGDEIYGFGFSRGAFTMRIVIALIASQGLVPSVDEADLDRRSLWAYREFRKAFLPKKFPWLIRLWRALRAKGSYTAGDNRHPNIRFIGLWDTVAAYGGPIAEITRAIDNWFYPLSMPDYELSEKVKCARHALALDDKRDAFQPLLWDEVHEDRLHREGKIARDRLQQVWFTGMHADVGGGYPDESLSYVSLLWMMEEAKKNGLRLLDVVRDRYVALTNSYGPLHDSRAGFGAYYRYQPRKIAAWVDPLDRRYSILQDPNSEGAGGRKHGLLRRVLVHESVIARIDKGTDRYAPIVLPRSFDVIPPQSEGETRLQADNETPDVPANPPPSQPLLRPGVRERLEERQDILFECQENLWDLVWSRRIAYFATLAATLLLLLVPFKNPVHWLERTCSDSRCVLGDMIRPAKALVPAFLGSWIEGLARNPVTTVALVILIYAVLFRWGTRSEARLRDESGRLWRAILDPAPASAAHCQATALRGWRESSGYQSTLRWLKWSGLPGLFGFGLLAALVYLALIPLTQLSLAVDEASRGFCGPEAEGRPPLEAMTFVLNTQRPCRPLGYSVVAGQVYDVVLEVPTKPGTADAAPWFDDEAETEPTGLGARSFAHVLGAPMRRVIRARYLQPLVSIRHEYHGPIVSWLRGHGIPIEPVSIEALDLKQDPDWPTLYRARFKPARSGSLRMFVNDARALLFFEGAGGRYGNNCGVARVTISHRVPRRPGATAQKLIDEPSGRIRLHGCYDDPKRKAVLTGPAARRP